MEFQRKPIKDKDQLLGLFIHEVFVHGLRFTNGREKTTIQLTNGLFTYAEEDKNEDPSYLVFEEGLATTLQSSNRKKGRVAYRFTWELV